MSPPGVLVYEEQQGSLLQEPPQSSVVAVQEGGGGQEENSTLCWEAFNTDLTGEEGTILQWSGQLILWHCFFSLIVFSKVQRALIWKAITYRTILFLYHHYIFLFLSSNFSQLCIQFVLLTTHLTDKSTHTHPHVITQDSLGLLSILSSLFIWVFTFLHFSP